MAIYDGPQCECKPGLNTDAKNPKEVISQVEQWISNANNNIDRLVGIVSRLEDRLAPALRQHGEDKPGECKPVRDDTRGLVPLASHMWGISNAIGDVAEDIDDIISRLEL